MKLKRAFCCFVFSMLMVFTSVCFAKITDSDLSIGGFYYGESIEDVIATVGEPVGESSIGVHERALVFQLKDKSTINIVFENGFITSIKAVGGSFMTTSAGIRANSTLQDIINAYGEPDVVEKIGSGANGNDTYSVTYRTEKKSFMHPEYGEFKQYKTMNFVFSNLGIEWISFFTNNEFGAQYSVP